VPAGRPARWGWHQLADRTARRLVAGAGVQPGDLVLDLGAGTGALTAPLLAAGARVVAFEMHAGRAGALRERFAGDPVKVVRADVRDLRLPRRPFRVVANPPFTCTTEILRRLLGPGSRLLSADLVVPRHVARRWADGRGHAAHRWLPTFEPVFVTELPRSAFRPAPPNPTAVLRLTRRH
jgi:23S rRNA (adenine-N6)-dimethyltransferase